MLSSSLRRRVLPLAALSVGSMALLTGCDDSPDSPEEDAQALATALTTGDFSSIPSAEPDGAEQLAEGVEVLHSPLDETSPEISVTSIEVDEPEDESPRPATAEVQLEHRWDLSDLGFEGEVWSYETQAAYTYDEDAEEWQLTPDPEVIFPGFSGNENIGVSTVSADRGRMMDDNGRAMVYNRDVVRIGIDKTQLQYEDGSAFSEDEIRSAAEELAALVGIDQETYADRVMAYGDSAFVEAIVHRMDDGSVTADDLAQIPGATGQQDQMSLAESADFAPLLIGRVGQVTEEHLEEDPSLDPYDEVGTSGLQAAYDETLRGTPGMRIHMDGETLFSTEPVDGEDLQTTLNPRLQNLAQGIVDEQDSTAAIVALRPSDGGILAAATHNPEGSYVSTATQSTYAPGSSFKMVSSLAMLRDGLSPNSTVQCPNTARVHGQVFNNYVGFPGEFLGSVSFRDAVATSCNTVFANAWDDVTSEDLYEAAEDLGIAREAQIGLPAQLGVIPDDSELNLHAANLFGQGIVEASPLGMATVAASITEGHTVHPHLVVPDEPVEPQGNLTEDEAEDLRTLMYDTVTFGTLSDMPDVPGPHVYAKTGTAQAGAGDDMYAHTWLIAFQGDLAIAIFVEDGEYGSSTNGPLAAEFLTEAQEILG